MRAAPVLRTVKALLHPPAQQPPTAMHTLLDTPVASHAVAAREPRLDLYAPIHRALRLFMCDTLGRVGRLDVDDPREVTQTLDQLDMLLDLCHRHLLHENRIVHPAIEALQPGGTQRAATEHQQHLESIAALRSESAAVRPAPTAAAALRLYRHLSLFVAENFVHMQLEESAHNALLWDGYGDAELGVVHQRILASVGPVEQAQTLRWLTLALPPAERAQLYAELQRQVPPDAFANLLASARELLDAGAWTKLSTALQRTAATAPSIA
jgi:hypothetical protein